MTFLRHAIPIFLCFALLAPAQQDRWQKSISDGLKAIYKRDFSAAETHLQFAFGQAEQLGPAEISRTQLYLGYLYECQDQFERAADLYSRAVSVREKALGSDHVDVAAGLELEARALRKLDRPEESDSTAARALRIRRDALRAKFPKEIEPEGTGISKVGPRTAAPQLIHRVEPKYSEDARRFLHEGTTELYIEVWPDGRAHNFDIRRGLGLGLDEKAVEAVQQWRSSRQ